MRPLVLLDSLFKRVITYYEFIINNTQALHYLKNFITMSSLTSLSIDSNEPLLKQLKYCYK
jgi:hypothetical protein